jgi:transposase InsO family protein
MSGNSDIFSDTVSLIVKAALLAARFSGRIRKRCLPRLASMDIDSKDKEIVFLRDKVYELKLQISILQKGISRSQKNSRYTVGERLLILWHIETFQIPLRRVCQYFGIARSTLYRWLHKIDDQSFSKVPSNKTTQQIGSFVWEIASSNVHWGRIRTANQLALLNIFISASTVRNILRRPYPPRSPASRITGEQCPVKSASRSIPAWYSNHVWSIDTTTVLSWGLTPVHVLMVIDHFSRKVVCVTPLEGPNAAWIIDALERAIEFHGPPKHIISDQARVFVGGAFAELLERWHIKPRFGAVGKHGSIAVTERVIKTLKEEWLHRVALIRGFDHLTRLCSEFECWYNTWRPHMSLEGARPDDVYFDRKPEKPTRDSKTIPSNIEHRLFPQTRTTGYRLKSAA